MPFPKVFPNVFFPERFSEETGGRTGIMDADLNKAHPTNQLRPRLRSGNRIKMSRTRNTITMARGTIAENARRQLSLINRCQMPRNVKRDWRFMGHRI